MSIKTEKSKKDFEQIPHTADIQLRVFGQTLPQFFRNAVVGMFQSIGPIAQGCTKTDGRLVCQSLPINHSVVIDGAIDLETLLVDFLSEALYLSDVHNEAYLDATVEQVSNTSIKATLHGVPVTGFEVVEIKAVTYHNLQVKQVDGIWQADIVFDI